MVSLGELQKEIDRIKERNRRVEKDKAWETSWTRRISIGIATYFLVALSFYIIRVDRPFISAAIPAVAYLISTLSLGILKSWWLEKHT